MRSSSALVLHVLRQHTARMSATPTNSQTSPLLCVLPHLWQPESSMPTSLYGLRFALPYSAHAAQSHFKVDTHTDHTHFLVNIPTLCSLACYKCSVRTYSMHIRSLSSLTEVLMSLSPRWQQADFGRHYLQYLAFTAKKANF